MMRGVGDDGQEEDVPPVILEFEVEAEMSPAEVEEHSKKEMPALHLRSRPHSPPKLPHNLAPFHSGTTFGHWLMEVMRDEKFFQLYWIFSRYSYSWKCHSRWIKRLIAFGKVTFRSVHQLYFLEGLFIIAASEFQKRIIVRTYRQQLQKFKRNEL